MNITNLQEEILEVIRLHEGYYPITVQEISEQIEVTVQKVHDILQILRVKNQIKSRSFKWMKGKKLFHILSSDDWPEYLFYSCGECHNKSTVKTCVFHYELYNQDKTCDLSRINVKIGSESPGCPWFITRAEPQSRLQLQEFLNRAKEARNDELEITSELDDPEDFALFEDNTDLEQMLPRYYCLFCGYPLHSIGLGFIPLLGSSVVRCLNCESLFKMVYVEDENQWYVLYAKEQGELFRRNFVKLAGVPSRTIPYEGKRYGIVIPSEGRYKFDTVAELLIIDNWIGKLSDLKYIVTHCTKDYLELKEQLAKDYSHISIIDGEEKLISPSPTPQQVGMLRLLRKSQLLNKSFCNAIMTSRITLLNLFEGLVQELSRKKAISKINEQISKLDQIGLLSVKKWNTLDMHAANAMWKAIAELVREEGFSFPGRGLGRFVDSPFKPHAFVSGYSAIDALINAVYKKILLAIEKYCSKINFCWDGLPGICHKETHGGVYGFILDLIEPFRLPSLLVLCEAIISEDLLPEEVPYIIGRRRQLIYYVSNEGSLNQKLTAMTESVLNSNWTGNSFRLETENYFNQIKFGLQEIVERSYECEVIHHKQRFTPWAVMNYQLWNHISENQRKEIISFLRKELRNGHLQSYIFQIEN